MRATRRGVLIAIFLVGATVLGTAATGAAQQTEQQLDQRAHRISSQLMSPFCPGRTLTECPSPSAGEWRMDVRSMVEEGKTASEIRETLEARMPNVELTGDPGKDDGMHPLWWVLLAAIILPALVIFPRKLGRRGAKKPAEGKGEPKRDAADELDDRLDAELSALDD